MISNDNVYNREYLVHPEFLIDSFDKVCNMEIIETDLFYNTFKIFQEYINISNGLSRFASEGVKTGELIEFYKNYNKTDSSDAASFELMALNRYYIFRKRSTQLTDSNDRIVGGSIHKSTVANPTNYETIAGMLNSSISNKLSQLVQINNDALIDKRTVYTSVNDLLNSNPSLLEKHPRIIMLYNADYINKNDPKIIDKIEYLNNNNTNNTKVGKDILLVYRQKKNTYYPIVNKVTKNTIWQSTKSSSNINKILSQIN
jgi:hypothetical protein